MMCEQNNKRISNVILDYCSGLVFKFGSDDIHIVNNCDQNKKSHTNLGITYNPPTDFKGDKLSFFTE